LESNVTWSSTFGENIKEEHNIRKKRHKKTIGLRIWVEGGVSIPHMSSLIMCSKFPHWSDK